MRTVLGVDQMGSLDPTGADITLIKVLRAPVTPPNASKPFRFPLSPSAQPDWDSDHAVRRRGQLVRDSLRQHPAIATLLDQLAATPPNVVQPIYLVLSTSDAELITWETLCDAQDEFLALDSRWPIGRITDPVADIARAPASLRTPVRMMAVISAFHASGRQEWEMVRDAAALARANGLDVQLKFLVGEAAVRAAIDAAIAGGQHWIEVSHVESLPTRLTQDIADWKPHILHFFCHGAADQSDQALELATANDYLTPGTTNGSVKLRTRQLVDLNAFLTNSWLITLNCCASGQAAGTLHSMAHQVVSAGFPAAVAMLEPVSAADAYEFTRAFYRALFAQLTVAAATLQQADSAPFEWLTPMHAARTAISERHAAAPSSSHEWSLPVLYVRGLEPFAFRRPAPAVSAALAGDFKLRASIVAGWLNTVRTQLSEAERLAAMQDVLADVPKTFWPTVDGAFPNGG